MKKINKGSEPNRLGVFRSAYPQALWEKEKNSVEEAFRCCSARYHETQQQLRSDQGNLCAYCEQDLLSGTNGALDDCRIEHFHPKSKMREGEPNWNLEWSNLLAVCCGGNQKKVINSHERFDIDPKTHSCDVHKGDRILDNLILNPLNMPEASVWLFRRSTGEIYASKQLCQKLGVVFEAANQTIEELNLNSPRLMRFRKGVLNNINDLVTESLRRGKSIDQAMSASAVSLLRKNKAGDWPSFFSVFRFYLGEQAEIVLARQSYI
ncbi:retron system putative HNH endonuclease [Pantoea agglomerans]|uniref:retron system putative HNH endonuclease n=1 Tax=Enterobacter agglomerans TaxID=549 RepID=UPI003DA0F9B8